MVDDIPEIDGIEALYGRSVHHCPYCDGWEWRDQPIAVYGRHEQGAGLALSLTVWSRDLLLCTDGPAELSERMRERLEALEISVREDRLIRLEGRTACSSGWCLPRGRRSRGGRSSSRPASDRRPILPARLGCRFTENGAVDTGKCEATSVPGLYVCGDASREAQFVIVAAAEGAEAAMAINQALVERRSPLWCPPARTAAPHPPAPAWAARTRRSAE